MQQKKSQWDKINAIIYDPHLKSIHQDWWNDCNFTLITLIWLVISIDLQTNIANKNLNQAKKKKKISAIQSVAFLMN